MQPSPRAQALAQEPVVTTYVASTSMNMNININLSAAQPKPPTVDAAPISARSEPTPRPKRTLVPAPEPPARRHWKLIDATVRGDVRRTVEAIPGPFKPTRQPTRCDPTMDVVEEVTVFIAKHASNVMDLLEAWDTNKDRKISKKEFNAFLVGNGFIVSRLDADALFDQFDEDGSGQLDYVELVKGARKAAFARGKIPKPIVKPGNRAVTKFNEMWSRRNQAEADAYKQSVKEKNAAWAARKEEVMQSRRARVLHNMKERQETARQRGAERLEPFPLRQIRNGRWHERTDSMWDEVVSKEVLFLPPILTARLAASEPAESPRRVIAEQRTPRHTRERPQSRQQALRQVHELPVRVRDARAEDKAAAKAARGYTTKRRASPELEEETVWDSDAEDL